MTLAHFDHVKGPRLWIARHVVGCALDVWPDLWPYTPLHVWLGVWPEERHDLWPHV